VTGAILGTLVVVAIPIIFSNTQELQLFASGLGMLILLMYVPGGLISVLQSGRDMLLEYVARRTNWEPPKGRASSDITTLSTRDRSKDAAADSGATVLPLRTEDVQVRFGGVFAVNGVSLEVRPGEVVGLIGTNGAGKSTTLRTISGLLKPVSGSIHFDGQRIDSMPANKIVGLGLAHSPEGRRIFARMTIEENLLLGAFLRKDQAGIQADVERAYTLFPILGERRKQAAGTLSGGEQQMLAMGRALMSQPKLLMLDEPSMGLSPIMMQKIMATIAELRSQGTTILLVEQNAQAALSLADQGHVMEIGKISLSGTGQDLLTDESVRKAYLGED
jgi:branched-chain amino acid transport system ATP-binding protein